MPSDGSNFFTSEHFCILMNYAAYRLEAALMHALGKLTGCEDAYACLAWSYMYRGKFSCKEALFETFFLPL